MDITAYFDPQTSTLTYLISDPLTRDAIMVDPVLDYDAAGATTSEASINRVLADVAQRKLQLRMTIETHAHADHLSASQLVKATYPAAIIAISERIRLVQSRFKGIFDLPADFATDGSQFDRLLRDDEVVTAGSLSFHVIPTPGHTPACSSYLFGDIVITGDALFMPDYGTGRCDFPGGSAQALYHSIKDRLYTLPGVTRVFTGHDYQPGGRPLRYESTIAEHRSANIQLNDQMTEAEFIDFRQRRDATLSAPKLLFPSVQVNIDGGRLPRPSTNGIRYLKIPLNVGATAGGRP